MDFKSLEFCMFLLDNKLQKDELLQEHILQ